MSYFSVARIAPNEADHAYGFIRLAAPEVPPDLWHAFAGARCWRGELLALRAPAGDIFGLASYRIVGERSGRVLEIDNFWTLELSRAAPGRAQLAATLQRIADEGDCRDVRQVPACGGLMAGVGRTPRNHIELTDPSGGTRFRKGLECSCGNLGVRSTAEIYPVQ